MNREKDIAVAATRDEGDGPSLTDLLKTAIEDGRKETAEGYVLNPSLRYRLAEFLCGLPSDEWRDAIIEDWLARETNRSCRVMLETALTPPKALTVNTSTPGNDLAATRMEELERRTLKLELAVSALMEGKKDD